MRKASPFFNKKVGSPRARGIDNDVALTPDESYTYNIADLREFVNKKQVVRPVFYLFIYS